MNPKTRKILRTTFIAIVAATAVMLVAVSCLSCENGPHGGLTDEQKQAQAKAFWERILPATEWEPQISGHSSGETPFAIGTPLSLSVSREGSGFNVDFISGSFVMKTCKLNVAGTTATLSDASTDYHVTLSRNPDGSDPVIAIYFESDDPVCYSLVE